MNASLAVIPATSEDDVIKLLSNSPLVVLELHYEEEEMIIDLIYK